MALSFSEFLREMTGDAYSKYVDNAHRKEHDLWLKRFKASDAGSKARIQARIEKLGRGVENASDLKMKKR